MDPGITSKAGVAISSLAALVSLFSCGGDGSDEGASSFFAGRGGAAGSGIAVGGGIATGGSGAAGGTTGGGGSVASSGGSGGGAPIAGRGGTGAGGTGSTGSTGKAGATAGGAGPSLSGRGGEEMGGETGEPGTGGTEAPRGGGTGDSPYEIECHGDTLMCGDPTALLCLGLRVETEVFGYSCSNECESDADCSTLPASAEASAGCVEFVGTSYCLLVCKNGDEAASCPTGMYCYVYEGAPIGYCLWH